MNIKKENAIAGVDMVIAIAAIIIFSSLILSLITYNVIENIKIAKETIAIIYITEIFEIIGMEEYDNITDADSVKNLIPEVITNNYSVEVEVKNKDDIEELSPKEDIIKKIKVILKYEVGKNSYECSMERLKVKE